MKPTRFSGWVVRMSIDERIYKGKEGGEFRIKHLPPKSKETMNSGEGGAWSISHLKGRPTHKSGKDYAANSGEGGIWDISGIKKGVQKT